MAKYKVGTILVPKPYYKGFEKLTIERVTRTHYHCHIMCGSAVIRIKTVDENYIPETKK